MLKLAFLLSHELFDLFEHFMVSLGEFQNVGDIELVDDGSPFGLLLFEALCLELLFSSFSLLLLDLCTLLLI